MTLKQYGKHHQRQDGRKLETFESLLNEQDIYIRKLFDTEQSTLAIIYRRSRFHHLLAHPGRRKLLAMFGYSQQDDPEALLEALTKRMRQKQGFPHEIGIFLGYPLEDVYGFVRYRGRNYKYCGEWKVYGNVDRCREMFQTYEDCRKQTALLLQRHSPGEVIRQLN